MEGIPPTDLRYDVSVQEAPIAVLGLDDPSLNPPWNQSFMSLLMSDPPADANLSSSDSFARTDLGVKSQSTHEDSWVKSQSTQRSDLWSSEEEEANYLASLGLGFTSSSEDSSTTSKGTTTVDDSWSMMEEQMLRAALADNRLMEQSVIQWQRIAEALPWRTPLDVFNRTNQMLQSIQRDLSTVMSQQQQQQQQHQQMSHPPEEEKQQQQIRQVRKRWSEEEDAKFRVGVQRYGWGNWKMVATLIPGRTVPQVTSHAQKYIKNHNNQSISKRRRIMN